MPIAPDHPLAPALDAACHDGLFEVMRQVNWRKRGVDLYYNDYPPPTKVCQVVASPVEGGLRCGLRFGVWFREVAEVAEAVHDHGLPRATDCTVQVGLEELVGRDQPGWSFLRRPPDADDVAEHLSWGWRTYGKSWIEHHEALEPALAHLLARDDRFPAAAICHLLERKGQAADLLTTAIFDQPLHARAMHDWGVRHGVL